MLQPHIRCSKEDVSPMVIMPGDPKRVDRIATFLEDVREVSYNREFKTITGYYRGVKITATSTVIGGASAAIAIEEHCAIGAKYIIRVGSCGALQKNINIGDLVIPISAVRDEGASKMYVEPTYPASCDLELISIMVNKAKKLNYKFHSGIVRSHDSFYIDDSEELSKYWSRKQVLGSDMETATLFTLGNLRGIKVASILNNVVLFEESTKDSINNLVDGGNAEMKGEENEILLALETFYEISKL